MSDTVHDLPRFSVCEEKLSVLAHNSVLTSSNISNANFYIKTRRYNLTSGGTKMVLFTIKGYQYHLTGDRTNA